MQGLGFDNTELSLHLVPDIMNSRSSSSRQWDLPRLFATSIVTMAYGTGSYRLMQLC